MFDLKESYNIHDDVTYFKSLRDTTSNEKLVNTTLCLHANASKHLMGLLYDIIVSM